MINNMFHVKHVEDKYEQECFQYQKENVLSEVNITGMTDI